MTRISESKHFLSAYVLTHNSEKLLRRVLEPIARVADELIIVDSGSSDASLSIAREFTNRIETRSFTNFPEQRTYAMSLCAHEHVLQIDSDEIMSEALVQNILQIKSLGFDRDSYHFRREWVVLGKPVHAMYPIASPDYPARIVDRRLASYVNSDPVHAQPAGCARQQKIEESLLHLTFSTREELESKLISYTSIAGKKLIERRRSSHFLWCRGAAAAPFAFLKWYFGKGGWRDGSIGITLAAYAARYTYGKYNKAARYKRQYLTDRN